MNNDLLTKNKKLHEEEKSLYFTISQIESVLKNKSFFSTPESIIALEKIKKYLESKKNRLLTIEQEQKKLRKEIRDTCHHEIIIKTDLNTNCAICNRLFINPPEFEHILVEYDGHINPSFYHSIDSSINEIASKNGNLLDEFEDKIIDKIKQIRLYRRTK